MGGNPNLYAYVANNPLLLADPLGLFNILAGGGISVVLPGGGEASGGIVFNPGLFGQQADIGVFGSAGLGAGLNVSGDFFVGFVKGGIENVKGQTVNLNFTFGPPIPLPISVTVFTDPVTGEIVGLTAGLGPSATPIGVSGTVAGTGTVTVRDALRFISRLISGTSPKKSSMSGRK